MARGLGKFINDIKRASEDIKHEINREADKQERDKKLKEYKTQVEKDLSNNNELSSSDSAEETPGKIK